MLRNFIVALLVLVVSHHQVNGETNRKDFSFTERVINALEKKCAYHGYDKNALEHFRINCFDLFIGPEEITDDDSLTPENCQIQNKKFLECVSILGEKVDPCLNAQEKELKHFILDIFNASSELLCGQIKTLNTNEDLKTNLKKCITTLKDNPYINPQRACFENSTIIGDHPRVSTITKYELCSDIMETNPCYFDLLKKHCPDADEVFTMQRGVITTAITACVPVLFRGTTVVVEHPTSPSTPSK